MIATLRNGSFARLWLGGLISLMGDWALNVGLPIYVLLLTHSVVALSITVLASSVPGVVLSSLAGVFVDRWSHKRTLVVTNVLLAVGLLPLLLVRTPENVWILYAVGAVEGSVEQFFMPAQNALLPALVGEEHVVAANSLNSLSSNLARLIGPALGGLIAATFALNGIVVVDAVSFLVAALLTASIVAPVTVMPQPAPHERSHFWRDWAEGMRAIMRERMLVALLLMYTIVMLGEGVFGVLYPAYVSQVLHGGALEIGQLMSAQAVGGLIGGLLVGWAGKRVMSRWSIGFSSVAFGAIDLAAFNLPVLYALALTVLGIAAPVPIFWVALGLFVAVGIPGIGFLTGMQSLMQVVAPEAFRGRIFGALGMTMGLFRLVGALAAGLLTDRLGLVRVLNIQGAGYVLAGLLGLLLLGRHVASRTPPSESAPPELVTPSGEAVGWQ
ncbi:MAG TPA: MFS transporter [Ktedonobacterales bacterium]